MAKTTKIQQKNNKNKRKCALFHFFFLIAEQSKEKFARNPLKFRVNFVNFVFLKPPPNFAKNFAKFTPGPSKWPMAQWERI